MSAVTAAIAAMRAKGMDPSDILDVVQAIADAEHSGGIPVDSAAEKRRAWDRQRKAEKKHSGGIPVEIPVELENASLSKNITTSKNKKERERGSRIPVEFHLSPDAVSFAKSKGLSDTQIASELEKFRNYWTAVPGAKGVKLDWLATWRNWALSAAGYLGCSAPAVPSPSTPLPEQPRQFATEEEFQAWWDSRFDLPAENTAQ